MAEINDLASIEKVVGLYFDVPTNAALSSSGLRTRIDSSGM